MVGLPQALTEEVKGYAATIPAWYLKKTEDATTGIPDEIHITVKYGLITESSDEVGEAIAGTEPIMVTLGRAGVFHNEDQNVLRLAVESPGLRALHNRVCKKLRNVNPYRDFRPHVTIAYMVPREEDPYYYRAFYSDRFEGRKFLVDQAKYSSASGNKSIVSFGGEAFPIAASRSAALRRCR